MKKSFITIFSIALSFIFIGCGGASKNVSINKVTKTSEVIAYKDKVPQTILVTGIFTKKDILNTSREDQLKVVFQSASNYFKANGYKNFVLEPKIFPRTKEGHGVPFFFNDINDIVNYCYPKESELEKKCFLGSPLRLKFKAIEPSLIQPTFSINDNFKSNIEVLNKEVNTYQQYEKETSWKRIEL